MRGLKLTIGREKRGQSVASFTDAWIETCRRKACEDVVMSHLLQMRGLKLVTMYAKVNNIESHLLQMRGLKPKRAVPPLV